MQTRHFTKITVEWPTALLLCATYAVWLTGLSLASSSLWLAVALVALAIVQHASLQHEVIHGHPTSCQTLNEALVLPSLILLVPYGRFRDTHLAHHLDANLTDPFDDPESNYLDPGDWARLGPLHQMILRLNNTLAGRMVLGPILGTAAFLRADWGLRSARPVQRAWRIHLVSASLVLGAVMLSPMPLWAYFCAIYTAMAILRIRTFLEHQAHEKSRARTVIIEDRGPLALLFLNNNYHVVHHMHPNVPWYHLPAVFRARKDHYLACNEGYWFASYVCVFKSFFWRIKDPVAHPLWRRHYADGAVPPNRRNRLSSSLFLKNGTEAGGAKDPILAATSASTTSVIKGKSNARASGRATQ